jgi:hypothetical protein
MKAILAFIEADITGLMCVLWCLLLSPACAGDTVSTYMPAAPGDSPQDNLLAEGPCLFDGDCNAWETCQLSAESLLTACAPLPAPETLFSQRTDDFKRCLDGAAYFATEEGDYICTRLCRTDADCDGALPVCAALGVGRGVTYKMCSDKPSGGAL